MAKTEKGFQHYDELLGGSYLKDLPAGSNSTTNVHESKGVFTENPAASRKYGGDTITIARLAVPVATDARVDSLMKSLSPEMRSIASQLFVGPGNYRLGYIDFLLQSAQESYSEKVQIVDTLSDNYIAYFFGQNPPMFQYSGLLFNTWQDDWRAAFFLLYEEILRGTKLARRKTFCTLRYDQQIVYGYLVNHSQVMSSDTQMAAQFNFTFLVKGVKVFRLPGTLSSYPDWDWKLEGRMRFQDGTSPIGGLNVSYVKRTFRQVGTPVYVSLESEKSESNNPDEGDYTIPPFDTSPATPATTGNPDMPNTPKESQQKQNIKNPPTQADINKAAGTVGSGEF